jgi:hypothetical protein
LFFIDALTLAMIYLFNIENMITISIIGIVSTNLTKNRLTLIFSTDLYRAIEVGDEGLELTSTLDTTAKLLPMSS